MVDSTCKPHDRCEAQGELLLPALTLCYCTPLPGMIAWGSDDTGLRYSCQYWLVLLEIAIENALVVSLAILGLGSIGHRDTGVKAHV